MVLVVALNGLSCNYSSTYIRERRIAFSTLPIYVSCSKLLLLLGNTVVVDVDLFNSTFVSVLCFFELVRIRLKVRIHKVKLVWFFFRFNNFFHNVCLFVLDYVSLRQKIKHLDNVPGSGRLAIPLLFSLRANLKLNTRTLKLLARVLIISGYSRFYLFSIGSRLRLV